MSNCASHRPFLSAIADGELDLVPPETIAHARSCSECGRELETQRRLTRRLVTASRRQEAVPARASHRVRRPRLIAATAIALLGAAVGAVLVWQVLPGQDQVAMAVSLAGQAPQLHSTDGAAITTWCEQEAERPIPDLSAPSMRPTGARMDRRGKTEIVTVTYAAERRTIRVSWLDARLMAPGARSVQARSVSGGTVLLVMSGAGTAVVSGDAPPAALWDVAAQIQQLSAPAPLLDDVPHEHLGEVRSDLR